MAANVYLKSLTQLSYKTESAATAIVTGGGIDPRAGSRIAIRAFGFTAGATATAVWFMQPLGNSTISTAVASNATTTFVVAADMNTLASNDYICIELDNGDFQFTTVATGTYSDFSIGAALTDTVAAGNRVWSFGVIGDTGHIKFNLPVSVQTTKEIDGGIFYANSKNAPMLVYHANDAAAAGSRDYVTVDYLNI